MPVLTLAPEVVCAMPYLGRDNHSTNYQCIYWDAALAGFGVRVYPSGRRVYVCAYRIQQRRRLLVLGRLEVLTLDQARTLALAIFGQAAAGDDPPRASYGRRSARTIEALCAAFIEGHAKKKRAGWKSDESCLRRHVLPQLKRRPVTSIISADIEPLHAHVGSQHPYAANRLLEVLRTMFNWGKVAGLVPKDVANPTAGISRFQERKRRRYLTTGEMPAFLRALEAEDSEYARHGLWLLLFTGLRSIELLKAKWTDLDWEAGTLFIGFTKSGEPLLAPISDAAMARLQIIPRIPNNPYIICGQKSGQPLTGLGAALQRVAGRAGFTNLRVHDLRRTVGSWLAQAGLSLHLIGDVLNHRDLKTTLGYAYFQTQQRRDALTNHGNKILSFAAPHCRVTAMPNTLSTAQVLQSDDVPASRHRHYFRREALHELVWTAPVFEVAKRLGVSDVALAKLCRRAAIPMPGRGYWARIESGQQICPLPLPPAPDALPELLRIRGKNPMPPA